MPMTVERLGRTLGAEVKGLDLKKPLDAESLAGVRAAFSEYAVLVFRSQHLNDDQQMSFTLNFGELEDSRIRVDVRRETNSNYVSDLSNMDAEGNIVSSDSEKLLFQKGNQLWHTDSSFKKIPSGPSILTSRVIPPEGGETEFADLRAAWNDLPEAEKKRLDGLIVEHSIFHSRERYGYTKFTDLEREIWKPVHHPMVRVHPDTGRKNLYVGSHCGRILGMDDGEAYALIDELIEFATQPKYVFVHEWTLGDVVMWDNRCVLHRGRPWDEARYPRNMRRTTVAGRGPTMVDGKPIDEYALMHAL